MEPIVDTTNWEYPNTQLCGGQPSDGQVMSQWVPHLDFGIEL